MPDRLPKGPLLFPDKPECERGVPEENCFHCFLVKPFSIVFFRRSLSPPPLPSPAPPPPLRSWVQFEEGDTTTTIIVEIEAGTGRLELRVIKESLAEPGPSECELIDEVIKLRGEAPGSGAGVSTRTFRFESEPEQRYFLAILGDEPTDYTLRVTSSTTAAGRQIPGDCNRDGGLDVSDTVCFFRFLFFGDPAELPCGDGSRDDVEYHIPFGMIRSIEPMRDDGSKIVMKNGVETVLYDGQDVSESNDGVVIIRENDRETYFAWDEIKRVEFD